MSKLLLTMHSPSVYGAGRMAACFALEAQRRGHDVEVAYCQTLAESEPTITQELADAGMTIHHVPDMAKEIAPTGARPLRHLARDRKVELLISSQQRDQALTMSAAHHSGIPGLAICMNQPKFRGNALVRFGKKRVFRKGMRDHASHVIVVAPDIKTLLKNDFGVDPQKISVVPCGIDPDQIPAVDDQAVSRLRQEFQVGEDDCVVVNLARIHRQKGQDILVRAVGHLKATGKLRSGVKVLLVGGCENEEAERLLAQHESLRDQLGLQDCVQFVGFRSDYRDFLHLANVFALSSRWEGLPLVLLEAFAAGVPVVMTEYGQRLDGFRQGIDGIYVNNEDPVALAEGLARIIDMNCEERKKMGREGQAFLHDNLTLESSLAKFAAIVENVLRGET